MIDFVQSEQSVCTLVSVITNKNMYKKLKECTQSHRVK